MRKLLIISGSARVLKEPANPIPAIERFDGVFTRQVRRCSERLRNVDILILSPSYGLVKAQDKIGFKEPFGSDWSNLVLNDRYARGLRQANLQVLQELFSKIRYSEMLPT